MSSPLRGALHAALPMCRPIDANNNVVVVNKISVAEHVPAPLADPHGERIDCLID